MKFKKRRKASRYRGSQTHKRGHRKRTRGSGNRGGKGMAGTGKRGDQRKSLVINQFGGNYFGKDKALRRGNKSPRLESINIEQIEHNVDSMLKSGKAKGSNGNYELNLKGYKILATGETKMKLQIKASAASKSAIEKVKKSGGDIILE